MRRSECAWLVDMGYVVKAGRSAGQRLDYFKFADYLLGYHSKVNSFVFNSFDESYGISPGLQRFYEDARSKGMTIRLHEMTGDSRDGTHKQRGVDVDMACHMVWQASNPNVGTLVLTTGDQDLIPAVKMCREAFGTKVNLFTYQTGVSSVLEMAASSRSIFGEQHFRRV